jgi:hypothetical protein
MKISKHLNLYIIALVLLLSGCKKNFKDYTQLPKKIYLQLVDGDGQNMLTNHKLNKNNINITYLNAKEEWQKLDYKITDDFKVYIAGAGFNEGAMPFKCETPNRIFNFTVHSRYETGKTQGYVITDIQFQDIEVHQERAYYVVKME